MTMIRDGKYVKTVYDKAIEKGIIALEKIVDAQALAARRALVEPFCVGKGYSFHSGMGAWWFADKDGNVVEAQKLKLPKRVAHVLMADTHRTANDLGSLMGDFVPKWVEQHRRKKAVGHKLVEFPKDGHKVTIHENSSLPGIWSVNYGNMTRDRLAEARREFAQGRDTRITLKQGIRHAYIHISELRHA